MDEADNVKAIYLSEVKAAICQLLDVVAKRKWSNLTIDTDEESASVYLWIAPNAIRVSSRRLDGWICPTEDGESWSFLDCCQRALSEVEKIG